MRASEDELRAWMIEGLEGNAASHAELLRALVPVLRGFYARRLNDSGGDVEDLVQETLIAVHTRRASYDRNRAFTAWLFAIARYKMIDHFRRNGRFVAIDDIDTLTSVSFEEASNAQLDVDRLLGELPPKQAAAIRRTRIEGLTTTEAARAGGIGESDVKVSVHRGLKALAARILRGGR